MTTVLTPDVTALSDEAYHLGEGARVVDGALVHVDLLAGRLLAHPGSVGGRTAELLRLDAPLGAVAPVAGEPGRWVAAAGDGVALVGADGPPNWLGRPEARHGGLTRMNDGVCDTRGRFWAGSTAYDEQTPLGSLYRVDPDGRLTTVLDGLVIANGPAVSADGSSLFLAESSAGTITRYRLSGDGTLHEPEVVVRLDGDDGAPDGMTTDAEGTLWVAVWGAGQVRRYSAEGEELARIAVPASHPTSVAVLTGALAVTTATKGLDVPGATDGRLLRVELAGLAIGPSATAVPVRPFGEAPST